MSVILKITKNLMQMNILNEELGVGRRKLLCNNGDAKAVNNQPPGQPCKLLKHATLEHLSYTVSWRCDQVFFLFFCEKNALIINTKRKEGEADGKNSRADGYGKTLLGDRSN